MARALYYVLLLIGALKLQAQNNQSYKSDKDLILYLPLNGSVKDESFLHNNCIPYSLEPAKDRFNNDNGAFFFGNNGCIRIENVDNFNNLTSFTLSGWVYLNYYGEQNNIISKVNPGRDFNLQITQDGIINFHTFNNDYIHFYSETKVPLNEWTHIVFTCKRKSFQLYVNGKPENFTIHYENRIVTQKELKLKFFWTGKDLTIGNLYLGAHENFNGILDEIRIYKKALKPKNIEKLFIKESEEKGKTYQFGIYSNEKPPLKDSIDFPQSSVDENKESHSDKENGN